MSRPILILLAGPNGAGKSTFYDTFLITSGIPFLNPDALTTFDPEMTGEQIRLTADRLRAVFFRRRASFITETVFSDTVGSKLRFLRRALHAGYDVRLVYIGLVSAELSERRVESRVAADGHDAPRHKLPSRFERSLRNLDKAMRFVPKVTVYDNSRADQPYRLVAEIRDGKMDAGPAWPDADWFTRLSSVSRLIKR